MPLLYQDRGTLEALDAGQLISQEFNPWLRFPRNLYSIYPLCLPKACDGSLPVIQFSPKPKQANPFSPHIHGRDSTSPQSTPQHPSMHHWSLNRGLTSKRLHQKHPTKELFWNQSQPSLNYLRSIGNPQFPPERPKHLRPRSREECARSAHHTPAILG